MPARRIDPACAQDQVVSPTSFDRLLADELAATVSIDGMWRIVLDVRDSFRSIKYIVRRIMNEQCAKFARLISDHANCNAVYQRCQRLFLLRLIDAGIGGGIDDDIRRDFANDARQIL